MNEITINSSLEECESAIAAGKQTFMQVGSALAAIMEGQKYRKAGFGSFAEYCETKWGFKKTYAYQLVNSAAAVNSIGDSSIAEITTESQARELSKVPVEQRVEVLAAAGPKPTAKAIKEAAITISAKPAAHTEVLASTELPTTTGTTKDAAFLAATGNATIKEERELSPIEASAIDALEVCLENARYLIGEIRAGKVDCDELAETLRHFTETRHKLNLLQKELRALEVA